MIRRYSKSHKWKYQIDFPILPLKLVWTNHSFFIVHLSLFSVSILENFPQSVQVWQTFICDFFNKLKPCHQDSQIVNAIPIGYSWSSTHPNREYFWIICGLQKRSQTSILCCIKFLPWIFIWWTDFKIVNIPNFKSLFV